MLLLYCTTNIVPQKQHQKFISSYFFVLFFIQERVKNQFKTNHFKTFVLLLFYFIVLYYFCDTAQTLAIISLYHKRHSSIVNQKIQSSMGLFYVIPEFIHACLIGNVKLMESGIQTLFFDFCYCCFASTYISGSQIYYTIEFLTKSYYCGIANAFVSAGNLKVVNNSFLRII